MKSFTLLLFSVVASLLMSSACQPKSGGNSGNGGHDSLPVVSEDTTTLPTGGVKPLPLTPSELQKKLINDYRNGEVEQCSFEGKSVYRCSKNAPDAGSEIYDDHGTRVGRCYYSTRQVDPICEKASDCKVIYRVAKNIWGKPEVKWEGDN